MALQGVAQIRYYKDNDPRNCPFPTKDSYSKPFYLSNFGLIKAFQVYSLPGTAFYILDSRDPETASEELEDKKFKVGPTGTLFIDTYGSEWGEGLTYLFFDKKSLEIIENNSQGYLVVNLLLDDGKKKK